MNSSSTDLVKDCQLILSDQGRLNRAIPGFVAREQQMQLSIEIARAIQEKATFVAEAGTGTGKTFAYLVPCLLSGKKAIISTATKTLQDQLFNKDIPLLMQALGVAVRVQNLKGRANYICRYRTELHAQEGHFATPQCAQEITYVRSKMSQLTEGERNELPEINEESPVWSYVTSTSENCLGSECEFFKNCFLVKARKRALEANVVIINHHLFFADSRLKVDGFGELLPGAEIIIFDEAHQLAEIAADFHGERFSTRQFRDLFNDILREWPILDLANQPLKQLSFKLDQVLDQIRVALDKYTDRLHWKMLSSNSTFQAAWQALIAICSDLLSCVESSDLENQPGLVRCRERLEHIHALAKAFFVEKSSYIRWVECFKQSMAFHSTPIEVADIFQQLLARTPAAYIFTSATLTMSASFDCFIKPLGFKNPKILLLPSPFDYKKQAILYLPRGLPDTKDPRYEELLVDKALPIIEANAGRCFFLFTSHRALNIVAQLLRKKINFPLLIQGDEAKPILLARFREMGNAVLLGTATFWEGVDVKGDALSCVIIDKLPFASPADPVIHGRMAHLKAQGLSGFDELSLPNAVLALKQGVGRLIRDVTDRGVLMIADPRLTGREYGRQIFASLPKVTKTRDEQKVLTFIRNVDIQNENTSN